MLEDFSGLNMPQMISNTAVETTGGLMMPPEYEVIAVGQAASADAAQQHHQHQMLFNSPDLLPSAVSLESSLAAYSFASPTSTTQPPAPFMMQQYFNLQQPPNLRAPPSSPLAPRPLTAAQKSALATVNTALQQQQQHHNASAPLPSPSVGNDRSESSKDQQAAMLAAQFGIDTEHLSTAELRSLAHQMQGVSAGTAAEIRRQMHIQCEQKRRAQIKDGFDELKMELPGYQNKRVSKAVLLTKAVGFIRQIKAERLSMMAELERLRAIHSTSTMLLHQDPHSQHSQMQSQQHQHQQPAK